MKRNKFSLSNYKLCTLDQGALVPVGIYETLPGDTIQQATSCLIRVSPLNTPVMHPVDVRIHHWFVPTRILWDDFEDFITGGPNGNDSSVHPIINSGAGFTLGSLADYLGVPPSVGTLPVSALPFRAYAKIWNEWYRDQDLQTELTVSTASGTDSTTNQTLQNVCWEKDYFTSSRAWTQKGDEVTLPLGTDAPITGIGTFNTTWNAGTANAYETDGSGTVAYSGYKELNFAGTTDRTYMKEDPNNTGYPDIRADLSNATSASINDLREAFALQRYKEARARYGSRYTEYLRYLGVRSSDARLQRPEYLGGGRQTIQFSEVLQTGVTTDGTGTTGVGNLAGHGIGAMRTNRFRRFFEEHGFVISLLSVKPKTIYGQGLNKMWSRSTKEDYHQKELEHIGQQEVLNKEVYAAHATKDGTFGYQDRYDEYRRVPSTVSGEFRTTLNSWHMAREFSSDPTLNSTFVSANPTNRVYQSTATDQLYVMANHSIQARRMLSKLGTPSRF